MDFEKAQKKAKELVSQMTAEEKMSQLLYTSPAIERLNINEYTTTESMITALKNDEITAVVTDDALARNILDEVSGLKILDSTFYSAEYKAAVVSEDSEKQTAILNVINELINDGAAQSIVDKYMEY